MEFGAGRHKNTRRVALERDARAEEKLEKLKEVSWSIKRRSISIFALLKSELRARVVKNLSRRVEINHRKHFNPPSLRSHSSEMCELNLLTSDVNWDDFFLSSVGGPDSVSRSCLSDYSCYRADAREEKREGKVFFINFPLGIVTAAHTARAWGVRCDGTHETSRHINANRLTIPREKRKRQKSSAQGKLNDIHKFSFLNFVRHIEIKQYRC